MITTVAGERVELLPQRALHWPRAATLLVADAHFGKDAHFRTSGFAVPAGTTRADLARLDDALDATSARRLVVLGDFLHDRGSRAAETFDALRRWRARRAELEVVLVVGNHDDRAGPPPDELAIRVVDDPWLEPPFAFAHRPRAIDGAYVLAGHVHPGVRLVHAGAARGRKMSVPIFLFGERFGILPSFGGFTGLGIVEPRPEDRVYLCGDRSVVER